MLCCCSTLFGNTASQKPKIETINQPPKTTAGQLKYDLPQSIQSNQWSLQCTIKVETSQDDTFFMVTGFEHGYAGIQQLKSGKRVAIFYMWKR